MSSDLTTAQGDIKHALGSDIAGSLDTAAEAGEVWEDGQRDSAVHFSLWSTLGISFSVTATPIAIGTYLALSIGVGGGPVYFFAYILTSFMNMIICLSMAELASAFPHSSGQSTTTSRPLHASETVEQSTQLIVFSAGHIHWTRLLGPQRYSKALSYIVSWLASASWCFSFSATLLFLGELILATASVGFPTYVYQQWHAYMVYLATGLVSLAINLPGPFQYYPHLLKAAVPIINLASLFLLVTLLVRATPKPSARTVFTAFSNQTGWTSDGVVFFLALLPGCTCVTAFDSATHMTDELANPRRQVPQVMIGSAVLSAFSGFIMMIVYLFCNVAPDNLLAPVGGQPIVQLLVDACRSTPLTIIGCVLIIISFMFAAVAILTTFSRVWWSIARSGSVPFSGTMAKMSSSEKIPVNSLLVCTLVTFAIGAIQLGSTTAINAILGSSNICFFIGYAIGISCLLWRGRSAMPKDRYINLGRFGPIINVVAVLWAVFATIWLCFPLYLPVTGSTM